jgi:hypothetical protein
MLFKKYWSFEYPGLNYDITTLINQKIIIALIFHMSMGIRDLEEVAMAVTVPDTSAAYQQSPKDRVARALRMVILNLQIPN